MEEINRSAQTVKVPKAAPSRPTAPVQPVRPAIESSQPALPHRVGSLLLFSLVALLLLGLAAIFVF
jgi:hypothetical protein